MQTLRVTNAALFRYAGTLLLTASQILTAGEKPETTLAEQVSQRPSVAVAAKFLPLKAVAMSAIIPGAGQAYNKSWIKAAAFLAAEAGGWFANRHYDSRGDALTDEFEAFADAHWSEDRYWDFIYAQCLRDPDHEQYNCSRDNIASLRAWERDHFSHHLPETKNQTYYENIGKYDQFNSGWDDTQGGPRDSANREKYDFMRADANSQYSAATLFASALLLNHVVSAIDAAWTTNRYNKKIVRSSFGLLRSSDRRLCPALTVKVEW
jgi:hypothetical protein